MAEYFEELEAKRALITDLLEVQTCDNMRTGDLIVVNSGTMSIPLRSGSSNEVLITNSGLFPDTNIGYRPIATVLADSLAQNSGDIIYSPDGDTFTILSGGPGVGDCSLLKFNNNGTSIYLEWTDVGSALGFTDSGQIISSIGTGDASIIDAGDEGQVLTIVNGFPTWQDPSSGMILMALGAGETRPRPTSRKFANLTWDQDKYSTFTNPQLSYFVKLNGVGVSANLSIDRICGTGPSSLLSVVLNSGNLSYVDGGVAVCDSITIPTDDSLYELRTQLLASGGIACAPGDGPIQIFSPQLKLTTTS